MSARPLGEPIPGVFAPVDGLARSFVELVCAAAIAVVRDH